MVTVSIKEDSKQAKAFVELLRTLPFVKFHESPYNPEFVKKIKDSYEKDKRIRIDSENIWDSI
jgi:hypothetical protein